MHLLNNAPLKSIYLVLFIALLAFSHSSAALFNNNSIRQYIPLSGTWKFKASENKIDGFHQTNVDDSQWTDIKVPSNWYLQGHDISGVAWYKKHIYIPDNIKGKRLSITFDGVDYMADIWLNGHYIGFHEGYFQRFSFDITEAVLFGKDNIITVKVNSPLEPLSQDWSLHKRLIKGIFSHHDTRPGGAWSDRGQEQNTGGIWGEVNLEIHDIAKINHIEISPQLNLNQQQATAKVDFKIALKQTNHLATKIQLTLKPYNFPATQTVSKQVEQTLLAGNNALSIPISIDKPQLWWPWEHGAANLYQLSIEVIADNKIIDSQQRIFGFREVKYDTNKNVWLINGKRLFLRGTNYIATQWLSEMTPEHFGRDIALMKAANINIVRIHAHISAEEFYQQCDAAGLLLWQDFALQWGYAEDKQVHDNAIVQAKDMVSLFYNHPSIITWSLINEPAWDAKWMRYKYKSYSEHYNEQLTHDLYHAILPIDNTRHIHRYSGTNEHPWLGWYTGSWLDYNTPTKEPIITEYGAQALPDIMALRKIINEQDLFPITEEQWQPWEYHNFQRKETFINAKIAMGNNTREFIANMQTYQAKLIKLAAESYRRQRYNPVNSIFQFMFVEDWPSMNWGIVDYWRSPKLGYYALKQAYQPVLPSIAWQQENFKYGAAASFNLWVINDLLKSFPEAQLSYSLRTAQKIIDSKTQTIQLAADSSQLIKPLTWQKLAVGHYEIIAKITDNVGNVLGINNHEFNIE